MSTVTDVAAGPTALDSHAVASTRSQCGSRTLHPGGLMPATASSNGAFIPSWDLLNAEIGSSGACGAAEADLWSFEMVLRE